MNLSPYARVGAKMVDMGYSVIPVLPGTKRPGTRSNGRWYGDLDWSRFCQRQPTSIELGIWDKYPDAGACVCLGLASGGLVAVDVDTEDQRIIDAITAALPEPSPVQKQGRKGFTSFYRARPAVVSTSFNINGSRVLDLLGHGRQTVLPPTMHPDTGRQYEWTTADTLEHLTTDQLPLLPDDIAVRLGDALTPLGYFAPVERPHVDSDGGLWREINEIALGRFDDWVPGLGIEAKRQHNGQWRGVAIWRGGDGHNVSFHPGGIKDFRDDKGMTAIDVVMAAHSCDFPTAEKWMRERLGIQDPPPVRFVFRKPAPVVELEQAPQPIHPNLPKMDPFDHAVAGGLIEKTAAWVLSTSYFPSRELSLLAAIGILGTFMGRRYIGPTNLSPNLYLVGLATTGSGKDAPLSAIKNFFADGFKHYLGAGDLASDTAIEKIARTRPVSISTLDEVGAWLQEGSARGAQGHVKGRRKMLLSLYGDSKLGGRFLGKDRAGDETMSSTEPVISPCFSIFGVSTPETFFGGLTEENTRDGFMNRLTVVSIPPCMRHQDIPSTDEIPRALRDAYEKAFEHWTPKDPLKKTSYKSAVVRPHFVQIPYADESAKEYYQKVFDWQEEVIRDRPGADGIIKRAAEQVLKFAMIRAYSTNPAAPAVSYGDMAYGEAIVSASVSMLSLGMTQYMNGSDFEATWKMLLRHIDAKGDKGITRSALSHCAGVGKIEGRKLDESLKYLSDTGRVEPKPGKRGFRYLSLMGREVVDDD